MVHTSPNQEQFMKEKNSKKTYPKTVHERKKTAKKLIQNDSDNPNHSHSRIT